MFFRSTGYRWLISVVDALPSMEDCSADGGGTAQASLIDYTTAGRALNPTLYEDEDKYADKGALQLEIFLLLLVHAAM